VGVRKWDVRYRQLTPVQRYCVHVLRLLRPGGAYIVLTCNHCVDELVLMHAQVRSECCSG
jgi:hypothetical protein